MENMQFRVTEQYLGPDLSRFIPRRLADGRVCCSAAGLMCDDCKAHVGVPRTLEEYPPPDPYEAPLAQLRAASATPTSRFEEQYAATRQRDLDRERAEYAHLAARQPAVRVLSAKELAAFAPPDPYAAALEGGRK